jgi:hypothetical protein
MPLLLTGLHNDRLGLRIIPHFIPFYGFTLCIPHNLRLSTPLLSPDILVPILHKSAIVLASMTDRSAGAVFYSRERV